MPVAIPQVEGITHRDVQVGSLKLHVAEGGSLDAPPIVLLHGWPQHWWIWRDVLGPLAVDHRVIAPDLRGLGWSDAPSDGPGYRKQQLADDVIALLDTLGLDKVDLIGHDWGGFAGFLVCLTAPERIAHYLPCSIPHLWPDTSERPSLRRLLGLWYQAALAAPLLGAALMRNGTFPARILQGARSNGRFSPVELATYIDVLKEPARAHATQEYYRQFLLHELRPLVDGAFHARPLTTKTRLLWGRRDPLLQGYRDDQHREWAPNMDVVWIDGAGHFLPEEQPGAVVEHARELFAS